MKRKHLFQNSLAILCFLAACHVSQRAPQSAIIMGKEFDTQGHRGCRGLFPENTIPAMTHALELGVTTLEMDVVISKDEQVLLSHDPYFNHEITTLHAGEKNQQFLSETDEKNYRIYGMNYSEIRMIDVGLKPHPRFPKQAKIPAVKPLLSEVIDSADAVAARLHRALPYFNIETKTTPEGDGQLHPAPQPFVELLMAVVKEKKIEHRVIIQSFDFRTLQYLHKAYPSIQTAMLIEADDKRNLQKQLSDLGFLPTIYSPAFELVTPELLHHCHEQGIRVVPWTVNDKTKITELKSLGVDGIISDYPDLFN